MRAFECTQDIPICGTPILFTPIFAQNRFFFFLREFDDLSLLSNNIYIQVGTNHNIIYDPTRPKNTDSLCLFFYFRFIILTRPCILDARLSSLVYVHVRACECVRMCIADYICVYVETSVHVTRLQNQSVLQVKCVYDSSIIICIYTDIVSRYTCIASVYTFDNAKPIVILSICEKQNACAHKHIYRTTVFRSPEIIRQQTYMKHIIIYIRVRHVCYFV